MPWDAATFHKHNRSLTPEQAAHAARIANAILARSGNEGMAIATANRDMQRRDDGGSVTEPPDYTQRYNTPLAPDQEARFRQQYPNPNDSYDYDMRGAWQSGTGAAANGHFPDTYKKPNHPTFSMQSQYNDPGNVGGQWVQRGGQWGFVPSATNLQMMGPEGLRNYFRRVEPGNQLMMAPPARRDYGGGVDTTDPGTATYADTGQAPTAQTMSPLVQGQIQRYSAMSPDQLQQLAVMMGGTPQGQLVQRVLQQKRMRPEQMQQPQGRQVQQPAPPTPQQQAQQIMQQGAQDSYASGGAYRRQPRSEKWIDQPPYGHDDPSFSLDRRMAIHPDMDIDDGITAGEQPPRVTNEQASGGIVAHRDMGGLMSMSDAVPSWTRQEERGANTGFLHGSTPGRADTILGTAPGGSFVLPADVVSGLGEGNSLAGARAVEEMLSTGPHGIPLPRSRAGMGPPRPPAPFHESNGGFVPAARMWKGPSKLYRAGGVPGKDNEAVALSDGEYVIDSHHVARFGAGDHRKGIDWFNNFVVKQRAKHIAKLKSLPPPVGMKKK